MKTAWRIAVAALSGLAGSAAVAVLAGGCEGSKTPPSTGQDVGTPIATSQADAGTADASELVEPIEFRSHDGALDLLIVARPTSAADGGVPPPPFLPAAWVYQICKRPAPDAMACPPDAKPLNYYGGTRLALEPGDLLTFRLVNDLPELDAGQAIHVGDESPYLAWNPTNIHTHGMLVSPHGPTPTDPTYGDDVYVLTYNPNNHPGACVPPRDAGDGDDMDGGDDDGHHNGHHVHADAGRHTKHHHHHVHGEERCGYTDYSIPIPADHPAGLFWFHPHAHGLALNQVSAGLAGIITVDDGGAPPAPVRHLILKDTQIVNGGLMTQEDSAFCGTVTDAGNGSCPGDPAKYDGGTWFFSVTGQEYPHLTIGPSGSQIWRLTNASGSATYKLGIVDAATHQPILFQVLSIDGIAISLPADSEEQAKQRIETLHGGKLIGARVCPGGKGTRPTYPVCAASMLMMPSARAQIWVTWRDASGKIIPPPPGASGVLATAGFTTGPIGDTWPPVNLATFSFAPGAKAELTEAIETHAPTPDPFSPKAAPLLLHPGDTTAPAKKKLRCQPLHPGSHRRVFFSQPQDQPDPTSPSVFGLAWEEVGLDGHVLDGGPADVTPFDPENPHICIPLGPGDTPVTETWELMNLTGEDHNFHIHQVKFLLLSHDHVPDGGAAPRGIWLDNVPLPYATSTSISDSGISGICRIGDWKSCGVRPVVVEIPFKIAGSFVYHCHILEHEDGGMMAKITVVPHDYK